MTTLSKLVVVRDLMDGLLAGGLDADVRFALELSRSEVLKAIRAQSAVPEALEAA